MSADNTNAQELMRANVEGVNAELMREAGDDGSAEPRAVGIGAGEWPAQQPAMTPERNDRLARALDGDFGDEADVEMEEQAGGDGAGNEAIVDYNSMSRSELLTLVRALPQDIVQRTLRTMLGMENEVARDEDAENPIEVPRFLFGNQREAAEEQESMDYSDSGESILLYDEPMEVESDGEGVERIPEDGTMIAEESGSAGVSELVEEHMQVDEEPVVDEDTDNFETAPETSMDYDTGDDGLRDEAFVERPNDSSSSESAAVVAARTTAPNRPLAEEGPVFAIPAIPARLQHPDSSNDGDVSANTTESTGNSQLSDGVLDVAFVDESAVESSAGEPSTSDPATSGGNLEEIEVEQRHVDVEGPATHSRLAILNEPSTSSDRRAKKRSSVNDDDDGAPKPKRVRFQDEEDEEEEDTERDVAFIEQPEHDEEEPESVEDHPVDAPEDIDDGMEAVEAPEAIAEVDLYLANANQLMNEQMIEDIDAYGDVDEGEPMNADVDSFSGSENSNDLEERGFEREESPAAHDAGVVEEDPMGLANPEDPMPDVAPIDEDEASDGEADSMNEGEEEDEVARSHVNTEERNMADRLRQNLRNLIDQEDIDCCANEQLTRSALYAALMEECSLANDQEGGVVLIHPDVYVNIANGHNMAPDEVYEMAYFREARWILIPMLNHAGTPRSHWSIACVNMTKGDVVVFDSDAPLKSVKDQRLAVLRQIMERCVGQAATQFKLRYALRNRCVQQAVGEEKEDGIFAIIHARRYLRGALDVSNRGEDCDLIAERQRLVLMVTSLRATLQGFLFRPMVIPPPTFHLPPPPQPQQQYHVVRRDHRVTQQRIRDCYRRLNARA